MAYLRRLIVAVIILVFLSCAWYGAEMLIHGESQRSVVDLLVAISISMAISGKLEKGAEENERKRKLAEQFAEEFINHIKEGKETEDGKDGSRKEV